MTRWFLITLQICKYLTQDSAEILIHAFISSKLDYCNSLLYGIPKYLVCLLPLQSRIIIKLLLLVYKALNGKAPSYISSLLSHRRFSRSLRSSGQELLTVPLAKLKTYGDRAFSAAAPTLWKNLSFSIYFANLHQSLFLKDNWRLIFFKKPMTFNFNF